MFHRSRVGSCVEKDLIAAFTEFLCEWCGINAQNFFKQIENLLQLHQNQKVIDHTQISQITNRF